MEFDITLPEISVDVVPNPKGDRIYFLPKGHDPIKNVAEDEFSGSVGDSLLLRDRRGKLYYAGVGGDPIIKLDTYRKASSMAARALQSKGSTTLTFVCPGDHFDVSPIVEGALIGLYRYEAFLDDAAKSKSTVTKIQIAVDAPNLGFARQQADKAIALGSANNWTRELGNTPANVMTPANLAKAAQSMAQNYGLKCTIFEEKELSKQGFGGILAVGQGSRNPPRLVVLEAINGKKSQAKICVVGKAITFDSGGLNLKTGNSMADMKFDKMGGCAVLGIMRALAEMGTRKNVVGILAIAENMPSGNAYRPSDIITTYDGKTIEIINTDAEGRIVLADAIAYARKKFNPHVLIELSTLTGSCMVALGHKRAGLFTEDKKIKDKLIRIGESTGDLVWPLPYGGEFDEDIKSEVATVKNVGDRYGGASFAASFLKKWADKTPFVHLDIAGPSYQTRSTPYSIKGASGFGVRLVTEYVLES